MSTHLPLGIYDASASRRMRRNNFSVSLLAADATHMRVRLCMTNVSTVCDGSFVAGVSVISDLQPR